MSLTLGLRESNSLGYHTPGSHGTKFFHKFSPGSHTPASQSPQGMILCWVNLPKGMRPRGVTHDASNTFAQAFKGTVAQKMWILIQLLKGYIFNLCTYVLGFFYSTGMTKIRISKWKQNQNQIFLTLWSVVQAGSNSENDWRSKILLDCPFKENVCVRLIKYTFYCVEIACNVLEREMIKRTNSPLSLYKTQVGH